MNHRKIQIATIEDTCHIIINGQGINVDDSVVEIVGRRAFKFARRPFAGAKRIIFTTEIDALGFTSKDGKVWLCNDMCIELLNVGENTKKFSVWFKPFGRALPKETTEENKQPNGVPHNEN